MKAQTSSVGLGTHSTEHGAAKILKKGFDYMTVRTRQEAWDKAHALFNFADYELEVDSRVRAGYDIYRMTTNYHNRICDLGNRLEVVVNEVFTNIWIDPNAPEYTATGVSFRWFH